MGVEDVTRVLILLVRVLLSASGPIATDPRPSLCARRREQERRENETDTRDPRYTDGERPDHRGVSSHQGRILCLKFRDSLRLNEADAPNSTIGLSPRISYSFTKSRT